MPVLLLGPQIGLEQRAGLLDELVFELGVIRVGDLVERSRLQSEVSQLEGIAAAHRCLVLRSGASSRTVKGFKDDPIERRVSIRVRATLSSSVERPEPTSFVRARLPSTELSSCTVMSDVVFNL